MPRGILLLNLGTPDSPLVPDVRRYLNEFLMDPRIIDVPYPIRRMIVSCFILPFRPKQSAEKYRAIWTDEGSPLLSIGLRLREALRRVLDMPVSLGMRYGHPSIELALREIIEQGIDEIVLAPLFPHYAMSSYETTVCATMEAARRLNCQPDLHILAPFFNHSSYIDALAESAKEHLAGDYDHVLLSFHGVPERHIKKSDPTGAHCLATADCCEAKSPAHRLCYRHQTRRSAELFAKAAGLEAGKYSISYQSRLGRAKWLEPSTRDELVRLAQGGVKNLLVMCPSFTADSLETLEEIGIRGRKVFEEAGGKELRLVPCLNDHPKWIETLKNWCVADFEAAVFWKADEVLGK
jgi:ferrochelatase